MRSICMFLLFLVSFFPHNLNARLGDSPRLDNTKQKLYQKTDSYFGNKLSFSRACWRLWYKLRKKYIYPVDTVFYCLNCAQSSPITDLRKQIYTRFLRAIGYAGIVSDPVIVGMQCCVGIADAWTADKSTRAIVKEDVIAFVAFYAFLIGLDHVHEKVIMNEAFMPSYVSKICDTLDTGLNALVFWKGIKLLVKGYIALQASHIIAEPITCFMYD